MRPNSTQLADCAERFLHLIAIREEVIAARKAALAKPVDWTDDNKLLRQIAKDSAKLLMTATLGISEIEAGDGYRGEGQNITISYAGGVKLTVPATYFGRYADEIKSRDMAIEHHDEAKAAACAQLETLAKLKKVQGINSFRSYVRARWDALDGEVLLSDTAIRAYFDEFIASQAAFACKI